MNPIVKQILKILGGLLILLLLIVGGVVVYVFARWDKPNDRQAQQMTAPRDSFTVASGEYPLGHRTTSGLFSFGFDITNLILFIPLQLHSNIL